MKHIVTIGKRKSEEAFPKTDHFGGELKYFSDCILQDREPEANGEEGLLDVRIIAAVEDALTHRSAAGIASVYAPPPSVSRQMEKLDPTREPELVGAHKPSEGR